MTKVKEQRTYEQLVDMVMINKPVLEPVMRWYIQQIAYLHPDQQSEIIGHLARRRNISPAMIRKQYPIPAPLRSTRRTRKLVGADRFSGQEA